MKLKEQQRKQLIDFMYPNMNPFIATRLYDSVVKEKADIPEALVHLDPYDPNLTMEQKQLILEECRKNPLYFYKRVMKINSDDPNQTLNPGIQIALEESVKYSLLDHLVTTLKIRVEVPAEIEEVPALIKTIRERFDFHIGIATNDRIANYLISKGYEGSLIRNTNFQSPYIYVMTMDRDIAVPIIAIDVSTAMINDHQKFMKQSRGTNQGGRHVS